MQDLTDAVLELGLAPEMHGRNNPTFEGREAVTQKLQFTVPDVHNLGLLAIDAQ